MIVNKKIILKKTPLDIPIILFLFSQIISSIFSIDRHVSIFGYYGRFNGGLTSIISYIILFYGFISNEINYRSVLKTSLISSLAVILWGLPGKFGHDLSCPVFNTLLLFFTKDYSGTSLSNIWQKGFNNSCWSTETNVFDPASRMFSTLGQPNWLGAFLAVNFFIGLYFLFRPSVIPSDPDVKSGESRDLKRRFLDPPAGGLRNDKKKLFYIIYLSLNFSCILFTRSRSALASVIIGLLLFFVFYYFLPIKKILIKYKTIAITSLIILMTITLIKFLPSALNSLNQPPTANHQSPNVTDSLDIRKIVWQGAIKLGLKYPFFGTGVETFAYSYFFVRPASHNLTSEWDYIYNKAHNEYLNYFATTGFTGLLTYLSFIAAFIYFVVIPANPPATQRDKALRAGAGIQGKTNLFTLSLFCGWLTILITNFFGFSTTTINLYFYLIPAFVIMSTMTSPSEDDDMLKNFSLSQKFQIFILLSSAIYFLFSIVIYFLADINYAKSLGYLKPSVGNYPKAAYYLDRAIKLRDDSVYDDKFSYSLAYISALASQEKNTELAKQYLELSNYFNLRSLKSSPQNVLYWKTQAKNQYFYYKVTLNKNSLTEGVSALEKARSFSPTDPKIPYSLAVYYSTLYDLEKDPQVKKTLVNNIFLEVKKMLKLKQNFQEGIALKEELLKKYPTESY